MPFLTCCPQLDEIAFLLAEHLLAGDRSVAGADDLDIELLHLLEHANPRRRIGVPHVVERPVDAGIAGAEDLVLREIQERIAGGVGVAEEQQLDVLLAVVEDELLVEDQIGHLEIAVGDVLAGPPCPCPRRRIPADR